MKKEENEKSRKRNTNNISISLKSMEPPHPNQTLGQKGVDCLGGGGREVAWKEK